MLSFIIKRDGKKVAYNREKITQAIENAMVASKHTILNDADKLSLKVEKRLIYKFNTDFPSVEDIQDIVETVLMDSGFARVAKQYIIYRNERTKAREINHKVLHFYDDTTFTNEKVYGKNIFADSTLKNYENTSPYYEKSLLTATQADAHNTGDIFIHNLDFYSLATSSCQIDLIKLFSGGFSTGYGFLREPNDITSYTALACIAIQSNQNDQFGYQSIANFDYAMAGGIKKTFKRLYLNNLAKSIELLTNNQSLSCEIIKSISSDIIIKTNLLPSIEMQDNYKIAETKCLLKHNLDISLIEKLQNFAYDKALTETDKTTYQAMEAFIHNLNTMHSRIGGQIPLSTINYGTDTSPEGKMVIKNVLLALKAGLGDRKTAKFPVHIFKVKNGINYNQNDINYDLFQLAIQVCLNRNSPNFSFIDSPFNLQYLKNNYPESEVAYFGDYSCVMKNINNKANEITFGRGNLSCTTINLPRIALKSNKDIDIFYQNLLSVLEICTKQLKDRFQVIAQKKVKNFRFLMGQGVWIDSDKLKYDDKVEDILKNGSLTVGFIGLSEALIILTGNHHGQSDEINALGLKIVRFMRDYVDRKSVETNLNYTLYSTFDIDILKRFFDADKHKYKNIIKENNLNSYTSGFNLPDSFNISPYKKIDIESSYHSLTNGGHFTKICINEKMLKNNDTLKQFLIHMKNSNIGCGCICIE